MEINDVLTSLFEKLERTLKTETVVGEPIEVGGVTLVPIISVSFGLGGGGGGGKDQGGQEGTGSGAGAGCKISPNAMLVIKDGEVSVIPFSGRGSLEKLFEMAPDIISKFNLGAKDGENKKEENGE
ncbi:GerW family sporulation protein [Candidatus Contubernalis alkaliaceticus]|uniref:GerW family sporulation protein n=1 Tax=Candidatus Contubernalis alkaliaceticus TaxID=338645 RepID=UPI001F4C31FD|nr:spore germination protein GerW family protein [Candidatus Contubernalis alkalaceticus]UNC92911.1 sporulation protein [Candidatus Contubernalis alkalaceticus]